MAGVVESASIVGSTFNGGPVVTTTGGGSTPNVPMTLTGNARATLVLLGLQADWFPKPTDGWHVGAAVGFGGVALTDDAGQATAGFSVAGSVFGGYQWWIGRSWSLGISAFVSAAPSLTMADKHGNDTGYQLTPFAGGVQLTLLYY